jgi:hypothetical protein
MASYSIQERLQMAKMGQAMPGGKHAVKSIQDLVQQMKMAGPNPDQEVKAHFLKRATALNAKNIIPTQWTVNAAKQSDDSGDHISHHGIKGQRWGIRNDKSAAELGGHTSADAKRAAEAKAKIGSAGGTHALSNKELQDVVTRMNLERQYSNLANSKGTVKKGHEKVKEVLAVGATINAAYAFAKSPAGKMLGEALKKKH